MWSEVNTLKLFKVVFSAALCWCKDEQGIWRCWRGDGSTVEAHFLKNAQFPQKFNFNLQKSIFV